MFDPAADAARAAREAEKKLEDMPPAVLHGQSIGECPDCGTYFDYGNPGQPGNLDPCPACGSRDWYKWGYRYNGDEYRRDEAWDRYDAPPSVRDDEDESAAHSSTDTHQENHQ